MLKPFSSKTYSETGAGGRSLFSLVFSVALVLLISGCSDPTLSDWEYVERAKLARDRGDTGAAIIDLKTALVANPKNSEARWLLGGLYLAIGDGATAQKELLKAKEQGMDAASLALPLAKAAMLQRDYTRAIQEADPLLGVRGTERSELLVVRGRAYMWSGDYDNALQTLDSVVEENPSYAPGLIAMARLALQRGDLVGMREWLDKARQQGGEDADTWFLQGKLDLVEQRFQAAAEAFRNALRLKGGYVEARVELVASLISQGKLVDAQQVFKQIPEKERNEPRVLYLKAHLAYLNKEYSGALDYLNRMLKVWPGHIGAWRLMVAVSLATGQMEHARTYARKILARTPDWVPGNKLLASLYLQEGKGFSAAELLKGAAASGSGDPQLLAMLSTALIAAGDIEAARGYLQRAKRGGSESAVSSARALALLDRGQAEQAASVLQSATEFGAEANQDRLALFSKKYAARDMPGALEVAARMQEDFPKSSLPYNLQGFVYMAEKQPERARLAFEMALKVAPEHPSAAINLAGVDASTGNPGAAHQRLLALVARMPDYAPAYVELAALEASRGNKVQAVDWAQQALVLDPGSLEARMRVVAAYLEKQDLKRALELLNEGPEAQASTPELLLMKARIRIQAGLHREAESTLRELLYQRPDSSTARYLLARTLVSQRKVDEAIDELTGLVSLHPRSMAPRYSLARLLLSKGNLKQVDQHIALLKQYFAEVPEVIALIRDRARPGLAGLAPEGAEVGLVSEESVSSREELLAVSRARWLSGQRERALAGMEQWLAAHPQDLVVRRTLANSYINADRLDGARPHLEVIVEQLPDDVMAINNLAWALRNSEPGRAQTLARRAVELAPDNGLVKDTLATLLLDAHSRDGQQDGAGRLEAVVLLREAWRLQPERAAIGYRLAKVLIEQGEIDDAKTLLEGLLRLDSHFPERAEAEQLLIQITKEDGGSQQ